VRVLLPARLLWDKGLAEYVAAARERVADLFDIRSVAKQHERFYSSLVE
jgi:hypothetical protein